MFLFAYGKNHCWDLDHNSNLTSTVRAPVFGRHQFFGTSKHYGKAHGSLLFRWMNYDYTACCWFPTSSNILILPSQFWQIRFESCWLHCSKCRILELLRYYDIGGNNFEYFLYTCVTSLSYWFNLLPFSDRSRIFFFFFGKNTVLLMVHFEPTNIKKRWNWKLWKRIR